MRRAEPRPVARAPAAALAVSLAALLASCAAPPQLAGTAIAPDPGRRAAPWVPEAELALEAGRAWRAWVDDARRRGVTDAAPADAQRVRAVFARVAAAASQVRPSSGAWSWEAFVPAGEDGVAWCLTGGGAVVDAALARRFAGDDDALAALVAHAVAHAVAGHARERSPMIPDASHPYGAAHESEADRLGVELAARAGFDPRAALRAADALAAGSERGWLAIHPPYEHRRDDLATYSARDEPLYRATAR